MKIVSITAVIGLALASCSEPKQESASPTFEHQMATKHAQTVEPIRNKPAISIRDNPAPDAVRSGKVQRIFIRTGRIAFETDDAAKTRAIILAALRATNGYVSRDDEQRTGYHITYNVVVHVPAACFDEFLASATKGITKFKEKNIFNEDVTAKYVDAESRLKTKKDIESRYRALLLKANSVKDVLEIERELGEIRTNIEAAEAQFRQLNDGIRYSTLHVAFSKSVSTFNLFLNELADAFGEGVMNLQSFAVVLATVWPFLLLAIAVVAVLNRIRNKRKVHGQENATLPRD